MCNKCKCNGSWDVLEKLLSIEKSNEKLKELDMLRANLQSEEDFSQIWNDMKQSCQSIKDLSMEEYKTILKKFSLPNVSQEDMQQLNCIYEKTSNVLYFPLIGLNNCVAGYKSLTIDSKEDQTVPASGEWYTIF